MKYGISIFFSPFVLTKENFEAWSNKKKGELIYKGLREIVENGFGDPEDTKDLMEKERKFIIILSWNDLQARIVMTINIDDEAYDHIIGENCAKDVWNLLKEIYGKNVEENIHDNKLKETFLKPKLKKLKVEKLSPQTCQMAMKPKYILKSLSQPMM